MCKAKGGPGCKGRRWKIVEATISSCLSCCIWSIMLYVYTYIYTYMYIHIYIYIEKKQMGVWIKYVCMYIYIYVYEPPPKSIVYAWYKNISYRFLGGALSLSSVLLKSTLNTAKMQGTWLHGFRSKLPGMDWGPFVVFAFATMLGSYLSTFLDSFLSKEIFTISSPN